MNSSTSPIPKKVRDLLVKLKFIAKARNGEKINLKSKSYSDGKTWGSTFYRWWYEEKRIDTIKYLEQTSDEAIKMLDEYKDTEFFRLILNDLADALLGIRNVYDTYKADPNTTSQLDVIISNILIQLIKNKKNIPEYDFSDDE